MSRLYEFGPVGSHAERVTPNPSASLTLPERQGLSRRTLLRTAVGTGAAAVLGHVGGLPIAAAAAGVRPMGLADRHKRPRDVFRTGVPTWVITAEYPAFIGVSALLREELGELV